MAITKPIKIYKSSAWRDSSVYTYSSGAWRTIKYAWVYSGGIWRKIYDYTSNAVLYGTSTYAFTPNGTTVYQQTGLSAGYGMPGDYNQTNDGLIIYNGGYEDYSVRWTGKQFTIPAGCTSIRIKCSCDNGGNVYLNQTLIGTAPHTTWAYYDRTVVPGDTIFVSLRNNGGSKYNGQVVRIDNLTSGGTILKTDTTWVGG